MRDIELNIPNAKGIPEGSLISIRLGAVRRQAVLGSDRPYRFQGQYNKSELMRVDVYMPIAQAKLMIDTHDSQGQWNQKLESTLNGNQQVSIDFDMNIGNLAKGMSQLDVDTGTDAELPKACECGTAFMLDAAFCRKCGKKRPEPAAKVLAKPANNPPRESSAKRHQVAVEAQPYFEQHDVLEVLRELLQVMIKEKPDDPYSFMIQVLESSRNLRTQKSAARQKRPQTAPLGGRQASAAQLVTGESRLEPARTAARGCLGLSSSSSGSDVDEAGCSSLSEARRADRLHKKAKERQGNLSQAAKKEKKQRKTSAEGNKEDEKKASSEGNKQEEKKEDIKADLAAIQKKLHGCLAEKVKNGGFEDVLFMAGFGASPSESRTMSNAMTSGPAKQDESSRDAADKRDSFHSQQSNHSDVALEARQLLSSAAVSGNLMRAIEASSIESCKDSTAGAAAMGTSLSGDLASQLLAQAAVSWMPSHKSPSECLMDNTEIKDILAVRDRLRSKLVEKHENGHLEPILNKLIDGEDDTIQQAVDEARLKLQSALVDKFQNGDLDAIFQAIAGPTSLPALPARSTAAPDPWLRPGLPPPPGLVPSPPSGMSWAGLPPPPAQAGAARPALPASHQGTGLPTSPVPSGAARPASPAPHQGLPPRLPPATVAHGLQPPGSAVPQPPPRLRAPLPDATSAEGGDSKQLEDYRQRLRQALTGAVDRGSLPQLLQQAHSISEGFQREHGTATAAEKALAVAAPAGIPPSRIAMSPDIFGSARPPDLRSKPAATSGLAVQARCVTSGIVNLTSDQFPQRGAASAAFALAVKPATEGALQHGIRPCAPGTLTQAPGRPAAASAHWTMQSELSKGAVLRSAPSEEIRQQLRAAFVEGAGAGPQPETVRHGSWCSEVGRLKDETRDLNDRTHCLEDTVSELVEENRQLRQAMGKSLK